MKEIGSSRLVRLLNDGFDGEVTFSGEVSLRAKGDGGLQLSKYNGKFSLVNERSSDEEYFVMRGSVNGRENYCSQFKLKHEMSAVNSHGSIITIPIELSPEFDGWVNLTISPTKIKY